MKIEKISYHKTFNLGNYSNEKIGIDILLSPEDDPIKVFAEAKKQVEKSHRFFQDLPQYEKAKQMASDPQNYTGNQVENSKKVIAAFEINYGDFMKEFAQTSRELTLPPVDDDDRNW